MGQLNPIYVNSCTYVGVVMLHDFHIDSYHITSCAVSNVDYSIGVALFLLWPPAPSVELFDETDEASNYILHTPFFMWCSTQWAHTLYVCLVPV